MVAGLAAVVDQRVCDLREKRSPVRCETGHFSDAARTKPVLSDRLSQCGGALRGEFEADWRGRRARSLTWRTSGPQVAALYSEMGTLIVVPHFRIPNEIGRAHV